MSAPTTLHSEDEFDDDDPDDIASMLAVEHEAAATSLKQFHEQAERTLKAFLDERDTDNASVARQQTRWAIFWRNVTTQRALLFGKTPQVEVSRKWGDAKDDIARIAGEMQERALNCDIESDGDSYATVIGQALDDRLVPCFAQGRIRYVPKFKKVEKKPAILHEETGEELAPEVPESEELESEEAEVDYVFWKDFLWTPARTWKEVRMVFFRNEMSKRQVVERFAESLGRLYGEEGGDNQALGESLAKQVPMSGSSKERSEPKGSNTDARKDDPWQRAEVWEAWDKAKKRVYWWVKGFDHLLDMQEDPLKLRGFWPCPRPMAANLTNSKFVPKPDREMVKDLFNEIDVVSTRITVLERGIRLAGVYDKTAGDIGRLVQEGGQNELIPANNWRLFAEKGGLRGQIDWLPLDQMILALDKLREYRTELIAACDQIYGMNDIMRGEASVPGVTATEQGLKARFASIRMEALQNELARFATDLQKLKAEVMSIHFRPETYLLKANAQYTFDNTPEELMQAVQLLKSRFWDYRIEVKSDSMAMADYAAMKSERTEFLQALGGFMQAVAPLAQQFPGGTPFFGSLLKWAISGFRGARSIEGELDRALQAAEQMAKQPQMGAPPPPDPKVQAQQLKAQNDAQKGQMDMQKEQFKLQADLARIQAETQAKDSEEQSQAHWNVEEAKGKHAVTNGAGIVPFTPGGVP